MKKYTYLVIIYREQTPTITPFYDLETATAFYDEAGAQWSETFLVEILRGPLV